MLKISRYIIILIGLFLLQSCDPARILVVRTASRPNCSVTIYANENILPHSFTYHEDSSAKKITIRVSSSDSLAQREKIFYYGLGGWGDNSLMPYFSKHIDSIIIVADNSKLSIIKQNEINDFLLKHRYGFAKHKLTIEAK